MIRKIKRNMICVLALTGVILAAAPTPPGAAQGARVDAESVREAIERTDEVIAAAREIVQQTRSVKARTVLEHALTLQNRARHNVSLSYNEIALRLTLEARKEARHAIGLARADAQLEERLRRLVEETTERLMRVRSQIAETGVRDAHLLRLVEEARGLLDKSRMNQQQLRGELALKLAENARRLAMQAEERFRRMRALMETCERRLTLLEGLAERARERVTDSGGEQAAGQLRIAEQQMARSRVMLSDGNYEACRATLERTERLLRTLVRQLADRGADNESRQMIELQRLIERAREMLAEHDGAPEHAYTLVERAREMLQRAESAHRGGNAEEARRLAEEARRILRRAVEEGRPAVPAERSGAEIENARELREAARIALESCAAEGAATLFERASHYLDSARERFNAGGHETALAEARIARNLFNRVREICAH